MSGDPEIAELFAAFGLGDEDRDAWNRSGLPRQSFEEWLTERVARRPTGRRARVVYGADDVHEFARRSILESLRLTHEDRLLEIGCGGGLLLREALAAGAGVTGIDHSSDMVELAREHAPGADVQLASAEALPFTDGSFTAVAMSVVFMFLADAARVLRECRRVLTDGGRLAVYTTGPELRGTPAVPDPLARLVHFHTDEELVELARQAGFGGASVINHDGGQLLTASAPR